MNCAIRENVSASPGLPDDAKLWRLAGPLSSQCFYLARVASGLALTFLLPTSGRVAVFILVVFLAAPPAGVAQRRVDDITPVSQPFTGFAPILPGRVAEPTPAPRRPSRPRSSPALPVRVVSPPARLTYPSEQSSRDLAGPSSGVEFGPLHRNVLLAELYFDQARAAKSKGDEGEAETYLVRILELEFPLVPRAQYLLGGTHVLLGQLQMGQGKVGLARASAKEAIQRIGPGGGVLLAEAYKLLALVADQEGKHDFAVRYRQDAMRVLAGP